MQRDFMPSLRQRRLWQCERRLEESAAQLNVLIATMYSRERVAVLKGRARRVRSEVLGWPLLLRLKVLEPLQRWWRRCCERYGALVRAWSRSGALSRLIWVLAYFEEWPGICPTFLL